MNAFQIVIIVLTVIGLSGGIIAVYIKTQVDIAKINVTITFFQRDLDRKELALTKLEASNKAEHDIILNRINQLIEKNVKE